MMTAAQVHLMLRIAPQAVQVLQVLQVAQQVAQQVVQQVVQQIVPVHQAVLQAAQALRVRQKARVRRAVQAQPTQLFRMKILIF